jgi:hypothetical protein
MSVKWLLLFTGLFTSLAASGETLHYTINWQSGLNLGEATLVANKNTASGTEGSWEFHLTLDAAVPGFTIRDEYKSNSDAKFCSALLEKAVTRGNRKTSEKVTFDQEHRSIKRETEGGGSSVAQAADACAHDALAFLQFARQELSQGRLAANQAVYLGAKYDLQLTYAGSESIRQENRVVEADKVQVILRGPKADSTFDLLFARDEVRTPLLARLPLSLGTFTVELLP